MRYRNLDILECPYDGKVPLRVSAGRSVRAPDAGALRTDACASRCHRYDRDRAEPDERSRVVVGAAEIEYAVRRSPGRKTVSISINPESGILVSADRDIPLARLDDMIRRKSAWIQRHLADMARTRRLYPPNKFISGERHLFKGQEVALVVIEQPVAGEVALVDGEIRVPVPEGLHGAERAGAVRRRLESWLCLEAARRTAERVTYWSSRMGVTPPRVLIRDQKLRWGSCSARGVVRFNWRIIQAPPDIQDYLVVHELAHITERNHGPLFWRTVSIHIPDWRQRRRALRALGARLNW